MRKIYVILIITLFVSCKQEPQIYFSNSQPQNKKTVKKFKKSYLGSYADVKDSSFIEIKSNIVLHTYYSWNIDSITNDTINIIPRTTIYETEIMITDTIFSFRKNEELKFARGIYFLNTRIDDNRWSLKLLKKNQKNLEILKLCTGNEISKDSTKCDINEIEDLQNCSKIEVTYFENDTTKVKEYNVEIGKKEMIDFIRNGGFINVSTYRKIK